ncbi:ubiquitin carboxyl-terminal hydrolase Ubp16 [Cryptococcus wingfieldii CBS 7118]|uniref:ubiquitinyl hydrolase 1 n=1 Tax=Cryptococcus wingfieldii CBS 7118 TaxID=1295528 RepID=A0A1E3IM54_9TREE|nr:ubiquitin carboxyl-terminal hydrolase Ubp16 [Cryptococcus wingfieldii CBS 7118]ODN89679.1 ubiquitin carboxyl-terminal hydrolase Ubp16 [Cryptococcus wingfieldii CBS 7118]
MAASAASPFLFQSALHDSGLVHEMLSNPLKFGPPMVKKGVGLEGVTREVVGEKESPKVAKKKMVVREESKDDDESEASEEEDTPKKPVKKAVNGDKPVPPSPKVKNDKQTNSDASSSKSKLPAKATPEGKNTPGLYPVTFDLTWPEPMASAKHASGLYNPSMACYANATLQILLHTPPVLNLAMAHDPTDCTQKRKKNFCMLCTLKTMAEGSHWNGRKAYSPEVHRSLSQIKKGFSKNKQEDTHEFFRFVTDALQNTALANLPKDTPEKVKHTSFVYRIWGGRVRSRVVCSRCNKPSDTFDSFLDLSLDVNRQGKKSIKGMMQGFTKEDKLEGDNKYHCDNCKKKANATKSFKIEQAPPILTLHLKRFSVNYNAYSGRARAEKFNQFIEFNEKLDIGPYMVDPNASGSKYRLFGVTCHRGTELRFGHYTSYVRGPGGQWFHADDEDMSAVRLEEVLRDKTAYLLSYVRVGDGEWDVTPKPIIKARVGGLVNGNGKDAESSSEEEERKSPSPVKRRRTVDSDQPVRMKVNIVNNPKPIPAPRQSSSSSGDEDTEMPPALPTKLGNNTQTSKIHAPKPVDSASFYASPISRPSNPLAGMSKKEKRKFKQSNRDAGKGKSKSSALPMPFAQGKMGGTKNRQPGVLGRMKGKV